MVLPTTGPLSFGDINVELGRPRGQQLNFNDAAARALAGKPSGQISISDFRGKSAIAMSGHTMVAGARTTSKPSSTQVGFLRGTIGSMSPGTVGGYTIQALNHSTLSPGVMFTLLGLVPVGTFSRLEVWRGSTLVFSGSLEADGRDPNSNQTFWLWQLANNPFSNGAAHDVKVFY